jgi:signal transduction histidine kinase/CheY-like chemotaxis protein
VLYNRDVWTPLLAGIFCAVTGGAVLIGWAAGISEVGQLAPGWRVMVPSTAFGFVCVGLGLSTASRAAASPAGRAAVVLFAALALILPVFTLIEYALGVRLGVEAWPGLVPPEPVSAVAGRMSAITATCFVLLATALGALSGRGRWSASTVRLAAGATLAMSWLAAVALSVDPTRISDVPRFPGMAVSTIVLMATASAGVLWCSAQAVTRLRDAYADIVLAPYLLLAAFALPIGLGRAHRALAGVLDPGLSAALVMAAFALIVTIVLWRGAAHLQGLHRQRDTLLANLEGRVEERTRELAEANDLLHASQDRLREADRRKDEFLATLAHELRNPLAPIRTGVELLKHERLSPLERRKAHEVIGRQMTHLVRLIDDLLDVSRITANKLTLREEPVDLADIVSQAVETVRNAVDGARHDLVLNLPARPAVLVGDATRLTQVVANLLSNACKYTPPGGRIEVSGVVEGSRVVLSVRDNGIGIPTEFLPKLFEKFSQISPPLERAQGGLGLGLALVRGIVTLHGGSVEVRSAGAGLGSEFILRLPLVLPGVTAPAATVSHEVDAPPPGTPRRVLVVDDNEDSAGALALLLRHQGHVVETAADGEAAVATAERFRPEVVLLDIGMPKLNGYEVCRRLRQQPWGKQMRIVAQTGWGQAEDRRRSREAGFDGHIVKPLDPAALDRVLRP